MFFFPAYATAAASLLPPDCRACRDCLCRVILFDMPRYFFRCAFLRERRELVFSFSLRFALLFHFHDIAAECALMLFSRHAESPFFALHAGATITFCRRCRLPGALF